MKAQLTEFPLLAINATISTRMYDGQGSDPFGQLGGADVRVLMFGYSNTDYLPADRIEVLATGETRSSYYPPR